MKVRQGSALGIIPGHYPPPPACAVPHHILIPADDTGAEPRLSEEVVRENGWYCSVVAAAHRTVTWGERSIWTLFLRVFPPFP